MIKGRYTLILCSLLPETCCNIFIDQSNSVTTKEDIDFYQSVYACSDIICLKHIVYIYIYLYSTYETKISLWTGKE